MDQNSNSVVEGNNYSENKITNDAKPRHSLKKANKCMNNLSELNHRNMFGQGYI